MSRLEAMEEYAKALKLGQKEVRDCQAKGKPTTDDVADEIAANLQALVGTTDDAAPTAEPRHPQMVFKMKLPRPVPPLSVVRACRPNS